MRTRKRIIVVVSCAAAAAVVVWLFLLGSPPPAIDYEAELRRLAMEGQSTDPNAKNGWPELVALSSEVRAIVEGIAKRERDIDEAAELRGETPEPWSNEIFAFPNCRLPATPRDGRLEQEALDALDAINAQARLRELRGAEVFVADMSDHNAIASELVSTRAVWQCVSSRMRRACVEGNSEEARECLKDLVVLASAVRRQPGGMPHMLALSYEGMIAAEVLRLASAGQPLGETFLAEAYAIVRAQDPRGDARVWEGIRIELRALIDGVNEDKFDTWQGKIELAVPGYGFDYSQAVAYLGAVHERWMLMRERPLSEVHKELSAAFSVEDQWSHGFVSDSAWEIVYGGAVFHEREMMFLSTANRLGLALVLHTERYGSPPQSLESIGPDLLERTPVDELAPDGRFRYVPGVTLEDTRLYSVGFDGSDDGGVGYANGPHVALKPKGKGFDFVIWPVECEPAPTKEQSP